MQDEMARSRQDLKLKVYRNHDVAEAAYFTHACHKLSCWSPFRLGHRPDKGE
jgi:hypothetical protein